MAIDVTAHIDGEITETAELVFSVAAAGKPLSEELTFLVDGVPQQITEVSAPVGGRLHLALAVPPGSFSLDYRASMSGSLPAEELSDYDAINYRRPSRYCESDKLAVIAAKRFAGLREQELINAVADWVHSNLLYVPGSSGPTDGAVDTYLAQQGVCRDFAHLTIAMLRACGLPARLVSVYAPGLTPMDFHAIAEVAVHSRWQVVDSTRMAPRASMVRIATGLDASETAFLTIQDGKVNFGDVSVTAFAQEGLPQEERFEPVRW